MTSFEEAAATLRVVIPGFLALRVVYWFGLRTQRTDLELVLWSIVASVPIYVTALWVRPADDLATLGLAIVFALILGLVLAGNWRTLVRHRPIWREMVVETAWDATLGRPGGGWLEVRTTDGLTYLGWVRILAESGQTDSPDLYLWDPEYLDDDGNRTPITGVEGVLIPRASIISVLRYAADAAPAARNKAADPGSARA